MDIPLNFQKYYNGELHYNPYGHICSYLSWLPITTVVSGLILETAHTPIFVFGVFEIH